VLVISFFWGLDKPYETLPRTPYSSQTTTAKNFDSIIRDLSLPANPCLYIHAPARLDPSMSPAGQDTVTAIVPVGHMSENGEQDWGEIRDQARQQVFRRLATLVLLIWKRISKFETALLRFPGRSVIT